MPARLLAIAALAAGVAAVVVAVVVLRGDGTPAPERPQAPAAEEPTPARDEATPAREETPTATATAPRTLSATATVRAFYRRAAAGDHEAAWRLAGPAMRSAFGNDFERFRGDLSSLRRIQFEQVEILERDDASVTVQIRSVATHDDRVDHCSGTLRTVRGDDGRWLVEPAGIQCTSG